MEQVACKYLLKRHHFLLKPQKLPNKKATSLYTKTKKPESSTRTPPASCTPHQEHLQYQNSETRSNILINKIQQKKNKHKTESLSPHQKRGRRRRERAWGRESGGCRWPGRRAPPRPPLTQPRRPFPVVGPPPSSSTRGFHALPPPCWRYRSFAGAAATTSATGGRTYRLTYPFFDCYSTRLGSTKKIRFFFFYKKKLKFDSILMNKKKTIQMIKYDYLMRLDISP